MPIRPENRARYSRRWPRISVQIRWRRARGRCEFCCDAWHGCSHPLTGAIVVLTVTHLDHAPEHNHPTNLAAMCQQCHNTYDAPYRRLTRWRTWRREMAAAGQLELALTAPSERQV